MEEIYKINGKEFLIKKEYDITPLDFEKAKKADELLKRIQDSKMQLTFTGKEVKTFREFLWAATEPVDGGEVTPDFFIKCSQTTGTKILLTFFLESLVSRIDMGNFLKNWEQSARELAYPSEESQKSGQNSTNQV
jgi:hypothetical protein